MSKQKRPRVSHLKPRKTMKLGGLNESMMELLSELSPVIPKDISLELLNIELDAMNHMKSTPEISDAISKQETFINKLKKFDWMKYSFVRFMFNKDDFELICPPRVAIEMMENFDDVLTQSWLNDEFERIVEMQYTSALKLYQTWEFQKVWDFYEGKLKTVKPFVKDLDDFYTKEMMLIPKGILLFEGQGKYESIENWKVGNEYIQKRPMSTSLHPQVAMSFCVEGGNLIKYVVTGNVKGYPLKDSFDLKIPCHEQEIHLKNGSRINVTKIEKKTIPIRSLMRWGSFERIVTVNYIEAELLSN